MEHHGDDESRFITDPEQLFEHMQERHVRHQMWLAEQEQRAHNFFDSLNIDQLVTLRSLFNGIDNSDDPTAVSAYYMGICTGILEYTFKVCSDCGEDHVAAELLADQGETDD